MGRSIEVDMKLSRLLCGALAASALALTAAPANAYIFGYSFGSSGNVVLKLDGTTLVEAVDQGWYSLNTGHDPGNDNYYAGSANDPAPDTVGADLNNFFVFDLSNLQGAFSTASLILYSHTVSGPHSYELFDYGGDIDDLLNGTDANAHNDLQTGASYGLFTYSSGDTNTFRELSLGGSALADINAAVGTRFAFGGSAEYTGAVVPEPSTWAMMILGFFGLGGALRARRHQVVSAFSA
jgi:hypothetical protein